MRRAVKIEGVTRGSNSMMGATVTVAYSIQDNHQSRKGTLVFATTGIPTLEEIQARIQAAVEREEEHARAVEAEAKAFAALKGTSWTFDV
jgi:cell pole-organizing protein PopZ